ncbi:MAG: imidazole glycerol phosphate synthase subunit HisH [Longimicrobiales bacterium]|nr:imidazole glycerol phosphate synthase subunit HisH [Longimicrobiales bacterium]
MNVALFDYGVGNLHSLGKALQGAGARVTVTAHWDEALAMDALVLPGVGAFGAAAGALPPDRAPIRRALEAGLPCLAICLGMQLLFDDSEESLGEGLGLVGGRVRRLRATVVPQMGWNDVETSADPLFRGVDGLVAYYANSYVCDPEDPSEAIAWSEYQGIRFVAAVRRARTWGVQFHPEKSSEPGRRLIANWIALAGGEPT